LQRASGIHDAAMPDTRDNSSDDARLRTADYRMGAEELRMRAASIRWAEARASLFRSRRHTTRWRRPLRTSQRCRRGPGRQRKGEDIGREVSRVPVGCEARLMIRAVDLAPASRATALSCTGGKN